LTNWRAIRILNLALLGIGAAILLGPGKGIIGINTLADKFLMLPFTWEQAIGIGLIYIFYSFYTMIRA